MGLFVFNMKKIITSGNAPNPVGPYNQAVQFGNMLFISGQIAIDQANNTIITESIEMETDQAMKNLGSILEAADMTFENVVKCSVFVKDMHMYSRINAVYSKYFNDETAPARELVEVANLPKFVNVEISAIAAK